MARKSMEHGTVQQGQGPGNSGQSQQQERLLPLRESLALQERAAMCQLQAASDDPRMKELFDLFDRKGSGQLEFSDVVLGLRRLDPSPVPPPLAEVRRKAVDCMLMADVDSNRRLDYREFVLLVQRLCVLQGRSFGQMAEQLVDKAAGPDPPLAGQEDAAVALSIADGDQAEQVYEALADRRAHALFELWDEDGDDRLQWGELAKGLRSFAPQGETVQQTAIRAAQALLGFDDDADQSLDRVEFCGLLVRLAQQLGGVAADTHALLDHLVMQVAAGRGVVALDHTEAAALEAAEERIVRNIRQQQERRDAQAIRQK